MNDTTRTLQSLLDAYKQSRATDPQSADRSLLEQGQTLLKRLPLDFDSVRAAAELHFWRGDLRPIPDLLAEFFSQPRPPIEEAWARWQMSDMLAMLRRCDEAIQSQRDFLAWARGMLPKPGWMLPAGFPEDFAFDAALPGKPADEALLIHVMYDGTQGRCWLANGKLDEWLAILDDIMRAVPATEGNRIDRRYYLRTAGAMLTHGERPNEALQMAARLNALSQENPAWPTALETQVDAAGLAIEAYYALDDIDALRQTGALAIQQLASGSALSDVNLRVLYHNTAAALYNAHQYDLSIPLFERAIALNITSPHTFLWLAASLWASNVSRERVLALLEQAAIRQPGGTFSTHIVPELAELANEVDFRRFFSSPPASQKQA